MMQKEWKQHKIMRNTTWLFIATCLLLGLFTQEVNAQSVTVNAFNGALHQGANTVRDTFSFPTDNSTYSQILMHFDLDCPTGGCDPWDRFANFKVNHNGNQYEIGRYVTPYANDWCDWTLDVTEYREMLKGDVDMESYIETWSNGWLINLDFEFIPGVPDYEYVQVSNLWVDYFLIYGDTIFYSIDLPEMTRNIPANTEKAVLRIVNTGHGQGNTQNAAEFSNMTHSIWVNGTQTHTQNLWKADCNQNPCSPQSGTWTFSRAGWCPGQEVTPDDFDITSAVQLGQPATLDYRLQPYFNSCSPWNPNCSNGSTCTQCNYNSGSHTQPNYKISSQLIIYSSTPLVEVEAEIAQRIEVYPNPSGGMFKVDLQLDQSSDVVLSVFDLQGKQLLQEFAGPVQSRSLSLDLSGQDAGVYLLRIEAGQSTTFQKLILTK